MWLRVYISPLCCFHRQRPLVSCQNVSSVSVLFMLREKATISGRTHPVWTVSFFFLGRLPWLHSLTETGVNFFGGLVGGVVNLHACFPIFPRLSELVLAPPCIPWYTFVALSIVWLREFGSGISISFIYLCCALCFSSSM